MRVEVKVTVTITDEVGNHIATAESSNRKDIGGNPRFYYGEVTPFAESVLESAVDGAAHSMDKVRALAALS